MRKTKYNAYFANCPTRQALDRLADKWTVLVVGLLEQRPHRFGELLRSIDGISQKMLTQTLRSLELDGLVDRRVKATVPVTVEYSLTATGRTLTEPLDAIRRWAEQHIERILAARKRELKGGQSRGASRRPQVKGSAEKMM
jgi:DNA-binding HxlR family transcriptional regulator